MNVLADWMRPRYEEIEPYDFYRYIWPDGELGEWMDNPTEEDGHSYVGILLEITDEMRPVQLKNTDTTINRPVIHRRSITDDLDEIDGAIWSKHFCLTAPISYAGKSAKSTNARFMYALCVEIDHLLPDGKGIANLINGWDKENPVFPKPTFLVCSGTGVHLYYVWEKPIPMFKNVCQSLSNYKRWLTKKLWNKYITSDYDGKIQYESIFQMFRCVGSRTKYGIKNNVDERVEAFVVGDRVSVQYMNSFLPKRASKGTRLNEEITLGYHSKMSLAEAQKLYPEWYERKIVNGEKLPKKWEINKKKKKGDKYALYNWWLKLIQEQATVNHRYYCMMCLAIYAVKNDVPFEILERDCWDLMKQFDELTVDENNHFTEKDVLAALQFYQDAGMITYPVKSIKNRSAIYFEGSRRNGQKQAYHLEDARAIRDNRCKRRGKSVWYEGGGRPDKASIVRQWRAEHPDGKKADCIRDTGLTKPTVYKWWN